MAMRRYESVAAYIAAQPKPARAQLRRLRSTIRKAAPAAVEGMAYGIPGYKVDGRVLLYFAAWKEHYALYPATAAVQAACRRELAKYDVGKGTIRFPIDDAVPLRVVAKVAKVRAGEVAARAKRARQAGVAINAPGRPTRRSPRPSHAAGRRRPTARRRRRPTGPS